jgi:hypothetical protein
VGLLKDVVGRSTVYQEQPAVLSEPVDNDDPRQAFHEEADERIPPAHLSHLPRSSWVREVGFSISKGLATEMVDPLETA